MSPKLVAAALAILAAPAIAQEQKSLEGTGASADMVIATDPQSFVDFFEAKGFPARLTEDSVGDPLVEYRSNGDKLSLFFYDCTDNTDCQAVQFYAGYRAPDLPLDSINAWNTERRFVRSYKTDEGVARIEMDVATSLDGLTHRDFEALLDLWLDSIVLYEEHINW
ncbi:YbjN domain-containing protein [Maritimibacter sp. UBA3975]|uniref:YbjN domain-containing protein n=1 Tax=Maritimibacter sp. UBA3975 TaxID=1946833 RepID=UPI000C098EF6|nr:YbjN domain-containing protein [Maritimibacter sp. UBA3975]MAM63726.1 hypothetical protein [Maritimibacter sp.]|tara:strand:+ start:831 stop:1328 length:498 start_codon:yes stop_codon:yes gene_type:complete